MIRDEDLALFNAAMAITLPREGEFVNDRLDPGGATNFGISIRWLKSIGDFDGDGRLDGDLDGDGDVDIDDIRALTPETARQFYYIHFWHPYRYDLYPAGIGWKVFDATVNMGSKQSHKLLQRALRANGHRLVDDGQVGPLTRQALMASHNDIHAVLVGFKESQAGFYRSLIAAKPYREKYRTGWLRRAYDED
ncbi:MAG: glycoside hydrolase family 108 protein [Magnetospiraceae bacterium]